jgi:hypothetical protein
MLSLGHVLIGAAADGKTQTMMYRSTLLILLALLLPLAAEARENRRECGISIKDWCPSRPGDPCNRHKNATACKADLKCYGMPYRGESVVPCMFDERGFASNCPTVGCTSKRPAP